MFFLDYFAKEKFDVEEAAIVVRGITEGCRRGRCSLVGNMTAEIPLMYALGDYDLAEFFHGRGL